MGTPFPGQADALDCEVGVLHLYCSYVSGASGAIPTALTRSVGFKSVAHTGTGVVDFILDNPVFKLLDYSIKVQQATYAFTAAGSADATLVDAVNATIPKVTVTFRRPDTGAATDTLSGDVVTLHLIVKTVNLGG